MKMKLFMVILTAVCLLSYLYSWYKGDSVPAWQAAIWVAFAFVTELEEYLEQKEIADWN